MKGKRKSVRREKEKGIGQARRRQQAESKPEGLGVRRPPSVTVYRDNQRHRNSEGKAAAEDAECFGKKAHPNQRSRGREIRLVNPCFLKYPTAKLSAAQ